MEHSSDGSPKFSRVSHDTGHVRLDPKGPGDPPGLKGPYDTLGVLPLAVLVRRGLREHHDLLDIGCGPLRSGRFLIQYLNPGCYVGIEPDYDRVMWAHELIPRFKAATFGDNPDFTVMRRKFDFALAHSVFIHMPLPDIVETIDRVSRVLRKPDGKFLFTFILSTVDNENPEWSEDHVAYSRETLEKVAEDFGFSLKVFNFDWPGAAHLWGELTWK